MFLGKSRNKFEKVGTFDEHVIAHPEKNRLKPYNQNQLNVKLLIWKFKKKKKNEENLFLNRRNSSRKRNSIWNKNKF
jgi:monoamine oxidase